MSKRAIDLYSGIGGWTLGMKLSGIENVESFEWWPEANKTHNYNFKTEHEEVNIRNIAPERDLVYKEKINFVVGSPPCTQFSFSNKGGNGDISDGLVDIKKFLEVVRFLKPKFWAMENIPRVAKILRKELNPGGQLSEFNDLVSVIEVVDSSDYGVPQSRKRMIAGSFPFDLFSSYKKNIAKISLGQILTNLSNDVVNDPLYGFSIPKDQIVDNENEPNLTEEEARINRDAKTFHPVYNNMSFPERLDRPARTITATCTRVSRESIIVSSGNGFRRLNVRERGLVQGFPITYQFYGNTLNSKFKMIGNAVPPILTYYIFQSMLGTKLKDLKSPANSDYKHSIPEQPVPKSKFDGQTARYPDKRKFMFAIPQLRFGSGVRFELSNDTKSDIPIWSFKFFYGNSKDIKSIELNKILFDSTISILTEDEQKVFNEKINSFIKDHKHITSKSLQADWISKINSTKPFQFIDSIGQLVQSLEELMANKETSHEIAIEILKTKNIKNQQTPKQILLGFLILSKLNMKFFKI